MLKIGIESAAYFGLFDYENGLKQLKAHGYDCVDYQEVASPSCVIYTWDKPTRVEYFSKLKACADELGVSFFQMHGLWPTNDKTPESREEQFHFFVEQIEIAKMLNSKYLVIHPVMPYGWAQETDPEFSWSVNKELFQKLLPYAESAGVVICLENIPVNMELGHVWAVKKMAQEMNSKYFKVCLDTGHANIMKDDLYQEIKALGEDLKCLHVHDNKSRSDEHSCPFFGNIDWNRVIQALSEIGYDGCISLETHISENMPSVVKEQMQICLAKIARDFADRIAEK